MTPTDAPIQCELRVFVRAERITGKDENGKPIWDKDEARAASLAAKPAGFQPMRGTYAEIARVAARYNGAQQRSGFLDYLYFPEPVGSSLLGAVNR